MSDAPYPTLKKQRIARKAKLKSPESVNAVVKSICDIMRRSNCAGALQYVPELTWILFLRILDEREAHEADEAAALGLSFVPSMNAPFRWRDWAAPDSPRRQSKDPADSVWTFVHAELLPHLKTLKDMHGATPRQKVISQIMAGVDRSRVDSEKNFCDILDKVHQIKAESVDDTHVFTLSQVYEGLLLKMGEKGNDGGQFFTPREIIRAMVRVVDPEIGKTVYDPGCGTGGFLAQSFEYMRQKAGDSVTSVQLETLRRQTFYGREKDNAVYPIALANLVLHGIDEPHIWHGNTLSGQATYDGLFAGAPQFYDYVLMNPPFGGKEGKEAQTFEYKTGSTQVLFLQSVLKSMKNGSHCGIVLDEGVLFRVNDAYVDVKRKLLEECDVYCIVSLPGGIFTSAGAGVKTNLVFFTKGRQTEKIWYYDLSDIKVGKKTPFTQSRFDDFFVQFPTRANGPVVGRWTSLTPSSAPWRRPIHSTKRPSHASPKPRPPRRRIGRRSRLQNPYVPNWTPSNRSGRPFSATPATTNPRPRASRMPSTISRPSTPTVSPRPTPAPPPNSSTPSPPKAAGPMPHWIDYAPS
jgi:type I restriction enzyme M protein